MCFVDAQPNLCDVVGAYNTLPTSGCGYFESSGYPNFRGFDYFVECIEIDVGDTNADIEIEFIVSCCFLYL